MAARVDHRRPLRCIELMHVTSARFNLAYWMELPYVVRGCRSLGSLAWPSLLSGNSVAMHLRSVFLMLAFKGSFLQ
ncbi:hypothetical protein HOLleu_08452 [Holothuria leucospilota]|uniref:Uncharacterized protein n=1 Tax=Holothuria leucospilota TaxID=206669 RepID=A0A9Q1CIR7_HOLLE|nr:hypothetical protein HOLleu_08452 [Holothuria leucospilota]